MKKPAFLTILTEDVIAASERRDANDTERNRRDVIRTVFAAIEGLINSVRLFVTDTVQEWGTLTIHEVAALSEEAYTVDERGTVRTQVRFLPLPTTIRLLTSITQRVLPEYQLDFNHAGWGNLKSSVEVRNRLVHPRTEADLSVSKDEVARAISGFYWILEVTVTLMEQLHDYQKTMVEGLRELKEEGWDNLREKIAALPKDAW